jgi:hypothetical protein
MELEEEELAAELRRIERNEVRTRAQDFVNILKKNDAYIPHHDSDGMMCLPNLPNLETGRTKPMIIRSITNVFWDACIAAVDIPSDETLHVGCRRNAWNWHAASTPILIRKLLQLGKAVVYRFRDSENRSWFHMSLSREMGVT